MQSTYIPIFEDRYLQNQTIRQQNGSTAVAVTFHHCLSNGKPTSVTKHDNIEITHNTVNAKPAVHIHITDNTGRSIATATSLPNGL